ncbi:MAG TPA: tetratricopeptide repeat protein [Anaerolineaceae bacterium]|nr:tetratricopeptide repeat protein [Anaerolineaceae bacterium]
MTTISLREYLQAIDSLIENGNGKEAVFHCTNILNSYPKCADVYRLLGKSLLEAGKTSEAKDVFAKLLSVIPDDFTAHAGLSEIYELDQNLDKAIWHMERAFESQPSNLVVQEELRKLFTARDGIPPAKIRLTRGALIRMYAKGELYQQAISEAQSVLDGDNERQDIRLLLAKMYHSSGYPVEAAETCSAILEKSPYCYDANLIMHEIEFSQGETSDFSPYSQRMAEVDPYSGLVNNEFLTPQTVPSDSILLDKPEYRGLETEEGIPAWAHHIGLEWPLTSPAPGTAETDFSETEELISAEEAFIDPGDELNSELPNIESDDKDVSEQLKAPDDELPDWIAKAGWIRAVEEESLPVIEEIATIESLKEDEGLASPAEELPDWLKSLSPDLSRSEVPSETEGVISGLSDNDLEKISSLSSEDIDRILGEEPESEIEIIQPRTESSEFFSEEIEPEEFHGEIASSDSEVEIPELPDWLREIETSDSEVVSLTDSPSAWVPAETPANQEVPELMENAPLAPPEIATPGVSPIEAIVYTETGSTEAALHSAESSLDDLIQEMDQTVKEPPELPSDIMPPPISFEEKPNKIEVPSWVRKILGTAEVDAPFKSPANEIRLPETTEDLEPLITELPGEIPEEGAISDDVNIELMSWLEDINPDDAMEKPSLDISVDQIEQPSEAIKSPTAAEVPEITFDNLTEPSQLTESEIAWENASETERDQIPVMEENAAEEIHERLSSLLDKDSLPTPDEIQAVEILTPLQSIPQPVEKTTFRETEISEKTDEEIDKLLSGQRYQELSELILTKGFSKDLLQQVHEKVLTIPQDNPETFDLWKTIGDVGLKNSDIKNALEAYKKAEELLFH